MKLLIEKRVINYWLTGLVRKLFPDKACVPHLLVIRIYTNTLRINLLDSTIRAFQADLANLHGSKLAMGLHEAGVT